MQGIPEDIQQSMNEQANKFAKYLYNKLKKELTKKKFRNTDELLNSLHTSYTQSTVNNLPVIHLRFALHGKFIDIKNLYWNKMPPVQELIEWLEHKDLSRFKFIPGYESGRSPFSREKVIKRLAWAFAWKKKLQFTHKQKKWKQNNLGEAIGYLTHLVAENFAQYAVEALVVPIR